MDRLMQDRTVFVIAHRLSTVRNAKAIMVLEHGNTLNGGSHDELIAQKGRYYQLTPTDRARLASFEEFPAGAVSLYCRSRFCRKVFSLLRKSLSMADESIRLV